MGAYDVIGQGLTADGTQFAEIQSADGRRARVYGAQAQQAIGGSATPAPPPPEPQGGMSAPPEPQGGMSAPPEPQGPTMTPNVPTQPHAPPAEFVAASGGDTSFLDWAPPGEQKPPQQPQQPEFAVRRTPGSYQAARWTPGDETTTRQDIDPAYVTAVQEADLARARAEAAGAAAEAAVAPEVNAAEAAAADAAQIYHETQVAQAQEARQEEIDRRLADVEQMSDRYAAEPPPSEKEFWKGLGPTGAMSLIVGQALSTYGQLMLGRGPSEAVDKAIGRSIQEQRMALSKQRNQIQEAKGLVAEYRRQGMDQRQAEAAADMTYRKQLDRQLAVRLGQIKQPAMRSKLEAMAADNRAKLAEKWLGLQKDTAAKVVSSRKFSPGRYVGGRQDLLVRHKGQMMPIKMAKQLGWDPSEGGEGDGLSFRSLDQGAINEAFLGGKINEEEHKRLSAAAKAGTEDKDARKFRVAAESMKSDMDALRSNYDRGLTAGLSTQSQASRWLPTTGGQDAYFAAKELLGDEDPGTNWNVQARQNKQILQSFGVNYTKMLSGAGVTAAERPLFNSAAGIKTDADGKVTGVDWPVFKAFSDRYQGNIAKGIKDMQGRVLTTAGKSAAADLRAQAANRGKK